MISGTNGGTRAGVINSCQCVYSTANIASVIGTSPYRNEQVLIVFPDYNLRRSVELRRSKEGHSPGFFGVSSRARNGFLNGVSHSRLVRLVGTVGAGDITRKNKASDKLSGVYRHHYKARSSEAAPTSLQSDAPR